MLFSSAVSFLSLSFATFGLATTQSLDFLQASITAAETLQKLFYNEDIGLWVGGGIPP